METDWQTFICTMRDTSKSKHCQIEGTAIIELNMKEKELVKLTMEIWKLNRIGAVKLLKIRPNIEYQQDRQGDQLIN